jgi:hypothetical protein
MPDEQDDYEDQTKHPTIAGLSRFSARVPSVLAVPTLALSQQTADLLWHQLVDDGWVWAVAAAWDARAARVCCDTR